MATTLRHTAGSPRVPFELLTLFAALLLSSAALAACDSSTEETPGDDDDSDLAGGGDDDDATPSNQSDDDDAAGGAQDDDDDSAGGAQDDDTIGDDDDAADDDDSADDDMVADDDDSADDDMVADDDDAMPSADEICDFVCGALAAHCSEFAGPGAQDMVDECQTGCHEGAPDGVPTDLHLEVADCVEAAGEDCDAILACLPEDEPNGCMDDADCDAGLRCDFETGLCEAAAPCTSDADCESGLCDVETGECLEDTFVPPDVDQFEECLAGVPEAAACDQFVACSQCCDMKSEEAGHEQNGCDDYCFNTYMDQDCGECFGGLDACLTDNGCNSLDSEDVDADCFYAECWDEFSACFGPPTWMPPSPDDSGCNDEEQCVLPESLGDDDDDNGGDFPLALCIPNNFPFFGGPAAMGPPGERGGSCETGIDTSCPADTVCVGDAGQPGICLATCWRDEAAEFVPDFGECPEAAGACTAVDADEVILHLCLPEGVDPHDPATFPASQPGVEWGPCQTPPEDQGVALCSDGTYCLGDPDSEGTCLRLCDVGFEDMAVPPPSPGP